MSDCLVNMLKFCYRHMPHAIKAASGKSMARPDKMCQVRESIWGPRPVAMAWSRQRLARARGERAISVAQATAGKEEQAHKIECVAR